MDFGYLEVGSKVERLIWSLARLRRIERETTLEQRGAISLVRRELEQIVGPTVKRAATARLLGLSQTALDRWISSGDIPVVITKEGRAEVPVHAVVELMNAVEDCVNNSQNRRPVATVLRARRLASERLNFDDILPTRSSRSEKSGHSAVERRSLVYHRIVAKRLNKQICKDARERLLRWRAQGKIDPRYAEQWDEILSKPQNQIAKLISQDTQKMADLRQNSPFAGTLNEQERRRVFAAVN